ncbi:hypothetical protein [Larkinella soli]|uniref:hypothetical protein n=1 Tax=Larkinella soli TaxID=1770527 RepID=UPI000FFBE4FB|nr:hypothetical protein [Larkinella soli]
MKKIMLAGWLLAAVLVLPASAQDQNPAGTQAGPGTQSPTGSKQKFRKTSVRERMRQEQIEDRRPTGDPTQLRPDSLRRGGATKVDTLRR